MQHPVTILILEDDDSLLQIMREGLGDLGHQVEMARNGQQAVELCWEHDFDILVTDIRMSGMDGLEALAKIREALPELRSLVITGFSSEADTVRALRLGVGEYLSKPFDMQTLEAAVERLVEQVRELRRQQDREQSLRRYLLWSLSEKARLDAEGWVGLAAHKASELAARMQWESEGVDCFQLASLVENLGSDQLPADLQCLLPAEARAILRAQGGLEGQILQAGRDLARGRPLTGLLAPGLQDALEGGPVLDPAAAPARRRRTALALAVRLEQEGQAAAAVQTYTRLLAAGHTQEAVLAALHLAQMAARLQRPEQQQEYTLQALDLARRQGPLRLAQTALEGGLLLADLDPERALQIFAEAEILQRSLENHASAGLAAVLASLLSGDFPGDELLSQLGPAEVRLAGWWLVPRLLEGPGSEAARRLTQRALSTKPALRQQLLQQDLSPTARQRLLSLETGGRPEAPQLRIFSLGVQEIYLGAERLADDVFKKNQKARTVLTYLALGRGKAFPDEVLAEVFWPEEGMQGKKNLYTLRSMWRRSLQPAGFEAEIEWVYRAPRGLGMTTDWEWWHDAEELRNLLSGWREMAELERLPVLRRAAALYRGPFLENCYLDWAVYLRDQLDAEMVNALLALSDLLAEGPPSELAGAQICEACQRALEIDRCSQEAFLRWMRALNRQNRAAEALKVFERCEKALRKELGVEPSIALVEEQMRARLQL